MRPMKRCLGATNKPGSVPPFEHVIDTIHELARREIQMTIATSRRSWSAKALLEEMKLDSFMPYILGADEVRTTNRILNPF